MLIRARLDGDIAGCATLLADVHAADGYPPVRPVSFHDFIASADQIEAWVADHGERIIGHVALHSRTSVAATRYACEILGRTAGEFGVARLDVAQSFSSGA